MQPEYLRKEPKLPGALKAEWEMQFKDQLAATTGEGGMPNYDRAAEYAYNQLFQTWGMTNIYGNLRWTVNPIEKYLGRFGYIDIKEWNSMPERLPENQISSDWVPRKGNKPTEIYTAQFLTEKAKKDVVDFIDNEILKDLNKNVAHAGNQLPGLGANYSFDNSLEILDESQITLEYVPGSERNNPESGFPNYYVLIDGDVQPAENGWCGIKGDELYQFLKEKKTENTTAEIERLRKLREGVNATMEYVNPVIKALQNTEPTALVGKRLPKKTKKE